MNFKFLFEQLQTNSKSPAATKNALKQRTLITQTDRDKGRSMSDEDQ